MFLKGTNKWVEVSKKCNDSGREHCAGRWRGR